MRAPRGYNRLVVVLAKGGPAGYSPIAPGTMGSILGFGGTALLWFFARDATLFFLIAGTMFALSIPILAKAERIVRQKDPNSFTLDEIVAVPFSLLPWALWSSAALHSSSISWMAHVYQNAPWKFLVLFAAFRFFDVRKPLGIHASQSLPYGLGIVADDVIAALYASLLTLPLALPHMQPRAG